MNDLITVLLVDDHAVVREGLRALLILEGGFHIVGQASNGLEAVDKVLELSPDVVVMDLAMPQLNGLEAARRIHQQATVCPKILILSAHGDDAYVEEVANLGVQGYLVKQASAHLLADAIRRVYRGETVYSPGISKRLEDGKDLPQRPSRSGQARKQVGVLTSREREIVQLVAESYSNKQIAEELTISIKTVEKHRQGAMTKLDIHDAAGLTRYAISAGIIENVAQSTIRP